MGNILLSALAMAGLLALSIANPVYAQTSIAQPSAANLPTFSRDLFPKLPASSLCTKDKLVGIWKLLMVYEVPSGKEMSVYSATPLQYFVFEPDSRYGEYRSILHAITLKDVRDYVLEKSGSGQQFTLNKSGMVFFYKNSIAVDSLACFIVENYSPPFGKGQLLLMPPQKAAAGARMLKVYEKVYMEFEAPYNPPKAGSTK